MASDDDDPRAPYKVYEGDELKGTYLRAPRRAERNSDSPSPSRSAISLSGTFWAMSFHDWPVLRAVQPMMQLIDLFHSSAGTKATVEGLSASRL